MLEARTQKIIMNVFKVFIGCLALFFIGLFVLMILGLNELSHEKNESTANTRLKNLKNAIEFFELECQRPINNLNELAQKPNDCPDFPENGLLNNADDLKDSWGQDIEYFKTDPVKHYYILRSSGPDKKMNTSDDILLEENKNDSSSNFNATSIKKVSDTFLFSFASGAWHRTRRVSRFTPEILGVLKQQRQQNLKEVYYVNSYA